MLRATTDLPYGVDVTAQILLPLVAVGILLWFLFILLDGLDL